MRRILPFEQSCTLPTSDGPLVFSLVRSGRRRTIEIQILPSGAVCVRAPRFAAEKTIHDFISQKRDWITRTAQRQKERKTPQVAPVTFDGSTEFLLLGTSYPLVLIDGLAHRATIDFDGQRFTATVSQGLSPAQRSRTVREQLIAWYKQRAAAVAQERIVHFRQVMNEGPVAVTVKTQKRIWGSCYAHRRTVYLNWQIVMAPLGVLDYIVVHELSHLQVPNHSRRFWRRVAQFVPDYKDRHRWLRHNAARLRWPHEGGR